MAKGNTKRLVSAQWRLKRMEELIDPYSESDQPQKPTPRREWVPGDYFINPGKAAAVAQTHRQKAAETD